MWEVLENYTKKHALYQDEFPFRCFIQSAPFLREPELLLKEALSRVAAFTGTYSTRNAAGIADADSGGFHEQCKNKVIDFMPGQSDDIGKGVTLRLSACPCKIRPDTAMDRCCGSLSIVERHRCRYGINSDYRPKLTGCGMTPVYRLAENSWCQWSSLAAPSFWTSGITRNSRAGAANRIQCLSVLSARRIRS